MNSDHTLRAVYVRQYTLNVEVRDDSGSSIGCQVNLNPPDLNYSDGGSETYDEGTSVTATANPCSGYRFDHWELDGVNVGTSTTYTFTMNSDHTLRAVYGKEISEERGPAPGEYRREEAAVSLASFRYMAESTDSRFNRDLLASLSGPAEPGYEGPLLILGGPAAIPYDWDSRGISFVRRGGYYTALRAQGVEFQAEYGSRDYCVLALDEGGGVIRIAGITRYGTRAGLLYLLNNPGAFEVSGDSVLLLRWDDSDGDGRVDLGEISVLMSWS